MNRVEGRSWTLSSTIMSEYMTEEDTNVEM